MKSGIHWKASNRVANMKGDYFDRDPTFDSISFDQLITGELEAITELPFDSQMWEGRSLFLKKLAYLRNTVLNKELFV